MSRNIPRHLSLLLVAVLNATLFSATGCAKEQNTVPYPPPGKSMPAPAAGNTVAAQVAKDKRMFSISDDVVGALFKEAMKRGLPETGLLFIADTATQKAFVVGTDGVRHEYPMSSSKYGNGNLADSNKTPLGWHKVTERIGGDQIQGRSFTSRRPDPVVLRPDQWRSDNGRDYVLTRILWLTGLEPGVNAGGNVDSYTRCIYIHGTNQEHLLGKPASHGCIRLSNRDVMELFDISEGRELYCFIR